MSPYKKRCVTDWVINFATGMFFGFQFGWLSIPFVVGYACWNYYDGRTRFLLPKE